CAAQVFINFDFARRGCEMAGSSNQVPAAIASGIICFLLGIGVTIVGSKWLGYYDPPARGGGLPGFLQKKGQGGDDGGKGGGMMGGKGGGMMGGKGGGMMGGKGGGMMGGKGGVPSGKDKADKGDKAEPGNEEKGSKGEKGKGDRPTDSDKGS